jgi:hypothetical protein
MVWISSGDGKGLVDDESEVVVGVGSGRLVGCTWIGEGWYVDGDGGNGRRYRVAGRIRVGMWGTAVGRSSVKGGDSKEKVGGL